MLSRRKQPVPVVVALTMLALVSCNAPGTAAPPTQSATANPSPSPFVPSPIPPTPPSKPLDLDHHPLYWFAPLAPMTTHPGRPFTGSDDFMDLFSPGAPWTRAAARIQVFKLYGEWVAYNATDAQLQQVVADLRQRGLALAVEEGPLNAPPDCGQGVESFAGTEEGRKVARRIKAAGGRIDILSMDEPFFFAHIYDGSNACHWPVEKVVQTLGVSRAQVYLAKHRVSAMLQANAAPAAPEAALPRPQIQRLPKPAPACGCEDKARHLPPPGRCQKRPGRWQYSW